MKPLLLLLCLPALALAQFYNISTIAGNGLIRFQGYRRNSRLLCPVSKPMMLSSTPAPVRVDAAKWRRS